MLSVPHTQRNTQYGRGISNSGGIARETKPPATLTTLAFTTSLIGQPSLSLQ